MGISRWGKCMDKQRHETRAEAMAALGNDRLNAVYRCPICDGYHLGRPTNPRQAAARDDRNRRRFAR